MSETFNKMDKMAEDQFGDAADFGKDVFSFSQRRDNTTGHTESETGDTVATDGIHEHNRASIRQHHAAQQVNVERESLVGEAARNKVDYRYDLMSPIIMAMFLEQPHFLMLATDLYGYVNGHSSAATLITRLAHALGVDHFDLLHLYAQALYEREEQFGMWSREQGTPELILLNHALYHMFRIEADDPTENHRSRLVWNVFTLIHVIIKKERNCENKN